MVNKLSETDEISEKQKVNAISNPLYGVTVDDVSNLSDIVTSLSSFSKKMTTRIVFDPGHASNYVTASQSIHNVSYTMGLLIDSSEMKNYTVAQVTSRTNEYIDLLGPYIDIWEIGNEINGTCGATPCTDWLGSDVPAKMIASYNAAKAKGVVTALTLYNNCNDSDMFAWVDANIPANMKIGLDYVLISWYPYQGCGSYSPNWQTIFDKLATRFPNSYIGFGELGIEPQGDSRSAALINQYYPMVITTPKYVGGYFWWYFAEDMVPKTKPLWTTLNNAISSTPSNLSVSLQINPSSISINQNTTITATVTGGTAPYSYQWSGLPNPCTGSNTNIISCAPNIKGTFNINVNVKDSSTPQNTASATSTLTVDGIPPSTTKFKIHKDKTKITVSVSKTGTLTADKACTQTCQWLKSFP